MADLARGEAVLVQPVVPLDALKDLQVAADQVVAIRVDKRNVGVLGVVGAKLATDSLLLERTEELRLEIDVNNPSTRYTVNKI